MERTGEPCSRGVEAAAGELLGGHSGADCCLGVHLESQYIRVCLGYGATGTFTILRMADSCGWLWCQAIYDPESGGH
jgi:hypothetical protein